MSFIRRVPVAMSALALALAALGNLLAPYSPVVRLACGAVAAVLVALLVARIALDFVGLRKELASPATLAVFPALPMAIMVLATYLKPMIGDIALWVWAAALALQGAVIVAFLVRHVFTFKLEHVLPSWFLIFVGFVVGSVTSPAFSMQPLGRLLLYAGLAGYAAMLAVVVYRMVRVGDLPKPALPTVAIFAAPPSLILAGYMAVTDTKQAAVIFALLAVAGLSLLFVFTRVPGIMRGDFHPGFAALTFPIVISAVALKLSAGYLTASGTAAIPRAAVVGMDVLAVATVLYVLARYIAFLVSPATD